GPAARKSLDDCPDEQREWEWHHLDQLARAPATALMALAGGHRAVVTALAFDPIGRRLATGAADGSVAVWDLATNRAVVGCKGHTDRVTGVAFSPDGKLLATCSADRTVRLWAPPTGKELPWPGRTPSEAAWGLAFSPDGKRLAVATGGVGRNKKPLPGQVRLWDVAGRKLAR